MKKIVIFLNEGFVLSKERGYNYMNGFCFVGDRGLVMLGVYFFFLCLINRLYFLFFVIYFVN